MRCLLICIGLLLGLTSAKSADSIPGNVDQLLVAIAKDWESDKAFLWCFDRNRDGWDSAFSEPIPVLLGRTGLAWGRGALPNPGGGLQKREGDRRTPAGFFAIGKIYGYPEALPGGSRFPYRQVGRYDAWIDDPKNPYYNQHYVATPGRIPDWFESQRMRLGDYAYKYKIEVRHNSDPPVPGNGSAIFFHIRRGPDRPSAGCTTMAEADLMRVIAWLRADKNPHYVVLPKAEYDRLQSAWELPLFR